MRRFLVIALSLFVLAPVILTAQTSSGSPGFSFAAMPIFNAPLFGASDSVRPGPGAQISVLRPLGALPLVADASLSVSHTRATDNPDATMGTISAGAGLHVRFPLTSRLSVRGGGRLNYGHSLLAVDGVKTNEGALGWWAGAGVDFSLTSAWSLTFDIGLSANRKTYFALQQGLGVVFTPGARAGATIRQERQETQPELVAQVAESDPAPEATSESSTTPGEGAENTREDLQLLAAGFDTVFPVFYRYYDTNPVGSVTLRNQTEQTISGIELVVNIPRFMDVAQRQTVPDSLAAGEEAQIPLEVLFNDGLLGVTQGTRVAGEFQVAYSVGGESRSYVVDAPLNIADRNAMTWDDDQKAASFVTDKEPTVLTFSRNVSSVVRNVGYNTLNSPFRTGMAMLESMALHGINYVVDPTTPYEEYSGQPFAIDFLQFPQQTFQFRAGDCDDLAICYAANLQAVGVKAAFITIPGHIYSAFSTGLTEGEANALFSRMDEFIIHNGIAWVPVETTLLQEGFLEAWQIGARQWRENVNRNQAAIIPIETAWQTYTPVGFDFQTTMSVSFPEPRDIESSYRRELVAFIEQEIRPQVARLETRIEATGDPRHINRLGVLYAKYGMFEEAEERFKEALEASPQADAYLNLGNLEFLKGNYFEASDLYDEAQDLEPDNPAVLLAVAKVHHEMENYGMAERAYASLQDIAPVIAADFEYLQFRGGDAARASDAADKRNVMIWGEDEE